MYSLGVILYGMLVGSLPFGKDLQYCGRYVKFCDWIRALPMDPYTGRLTFEKQYFDGSGRLDVCSFAASSSASSSSWSSLHHHHSSSSMHIIHPSSTSAAASLSTCPHSTAGSSVVEFPHWFFPPKLNIDARMLLVGLLHPDPVHRISCEEASKSLWVMQLQ